MIPLLKSLPHGDYATALALVAATSVVVLGVLEYGLYVYRRWLAACRDRRETKRLARPQ